MAEPIRNYTPHQNAREELRRKLEAAPVEHAEAVLSAYRLLQAASDHGLLDLLRGGIGAGDALIGKATEFANTPQGTRALRNLLAIFRLLGEIDPAILDAAAEAHSRIRRRELQEQPQSVLEVLRRFAGPNARRALGMIAEIANSIGAALDGGESRSEEDHDRGSSPSGRASGIAVPVVFSTVAVLAGIWIARRSASQ